MEPPSRNFADQQSTAETVPSQSTITTTPTTNTTTTTTENNVQIIFREIHKNAWLRRLPTGERKSGSGAYSKRGENVWVVFCVHDDRDPYLEVYMDQKVAAAHRPEWCAPLSACLHVTPTICATQEDHHEFVVTLRTGIVKLAAPTWDVMMEWVTTLRSKLVEMKILTPPENVYSQMPQLPRTLLPTRDPNSPLPPTPAGPLSLVPGTEMAAPDIIDTSANSTSDHIDSTPSPLQPSTTAQTFPSPVTIQTTSQPTTLPTPIPVRPLPLQYSASTPSMQPSSLVTPIPRPTNSVQPTPLQHSASTSLVQPSSLLTPIPRPTVSSQPSPLQHSASTSLVQPSSLPTPIPRPTVSSQPSPLQHSASTSLVQPSSLTTSIPRPTVSVQPTSLQHSASTPHVGVRENVRLAATSTTSLYITQSEPPVYNRSPAILNRAISEPGQNVTVIEVDGPIESSPNVFNFNFMSNSLDEEDDPSHYEHLYPGETTQNNMEPISPIQITTPTLENTTGENVSSSTTSTQSNTISTQTEPRAPISPRSQENLDTRRAEVLPRRRGPRLVPIPTVMEQRRPLAPVPHPFRPPLVPQAVLTLREQQVLQLTREIRHPGGVRLQLRRRDCSGSIALVDAFGAVWVAGWKQREHPTLYNALHIGDRLLSVVGVPVPNAAEAHRLIRGANCLFVEFVVRRVPFGRVLAIRRELEGQDLGLELEGGTAEIRSVRPLSPAARAGLPPKAPTCDGLSLSNWVLTEVNSRPLNLFFKDGEVRDRLNAVGMDISILVQPFDLVKQLKKQLKSLRGYKDYLVQ